MSKASFRHLVTILVISAPGCDSGETSPGASSETTNVAAPSGAASTSGGNNTTTGGGNTTSTSTTGGGNTGAGVIHTTGLGCTPGTLTSTGQLQGQFGKVKVSVDGLEYFIQVNEWNSTAQQTMSYGGNHFFKMLVQQAQVPTNGAPTGYPSIFIGANSNNSTDGSNLPKQVSTIGAIPTKWVWNDAGTLADRQGNSYNAAYDVWFSVNSGGEPSSSHPSGAFLMVWYHKPFDAQPLGSNVAPSSTVANVPGTWNVWIGTNNGTPAISYVATQTIASMDFDLNHFIRDAIARGGTVQNSHYLTNVFAGFEIWRGGVNLETTSFCVEVI
jgi:hypothetical protein